MNEPKNSATSVNQMVSANAAPQVTPLSATRLRAAVYSAIVKPEVVCRDDEASQFIDIKRNRAPTGDRGDGRIVVSTIDHATNIRTSAEGDGAL